jgi:hypothetical protein
MTPELHLDGRISYRFFLAAQDFAGSPATVMLVKPVQAAALRRAVFNLTISTK